MKTFSESNELAKYLKVCEATIVRWRKAGMPYKRRGLNRYAYDRDAVLTWMVQRGPSYQQYVELLLAEK